MLMVKSYKRTPVVNVHDASNNKVTNLVTFEGKINLFATNTLTFHRYTKHWQFTIVIHTLTLSPILQDKTARHSTDTRRYFFLHQYTHHDNA